MKICPIDCLSTVCEHAKTMTSKDTNWEKDLANMLRQVLDTESVDVDKFMSLVRAEKEKSRKEGLEKAKEILRTRVDDSNNYSLTQEMSKHPAPGRYIDSAMVGYNFALSEASQKIQEEIDKS